jgi:Na+-transporting NADH:ubiquinone oxidoreductase subunit D
MTEPGRFVDVLKKNIWTENEIFIQNLGICSTLAVTNMMSNTIVMTAAVVFVTAMSCLSVSIFKNATPRRVRMIVQIIFIAFYTIVVDIFLRAYIPDISKSLGPYVGLIITNCILMGRTEAFAQNNPPLISFWDGFTAGVGYMIVLLLISVVRELLGFGKLLGFQVLPDNFVPWTIMVSPPSAFFLIAAVIWISKTILMKKGKKA